MAIVACSIDGCDGFAGVPGTARGWCSKHYNRWLRNGDPAVRTKRVVTEQCSVPECGKPHDAQGLCSAHVTNLRRHGAPTIRKRGEVVNGKKICSMCNVDLPVSAFGKRRDQLTPSCKACSRAYRIARYETDIEASRAANREASAKYARQRRDAARKRRARVRLVTVEDVSSIQVFDRDRWTCGICGDPIPRVTRWPHPLSPSLDHRIPLANGGEHSYANTQASHLACNMRKGADST